ncbi:MAG: B12-binding domain-containing radical SAM protein [Candidatus Odinarchaeota archaeon]
MNNHNSNYRLLLINQSRYNDITYEYLYHHGLRGMREIILNDFPEIEQYVPEEAFDFDPIWPGRLKFSLRDYDSSPSCSFIADNLETPTEIMVGDIQSSDIIETLDKAKKIGHPFTHVGFSVFVTGYTRFVESAMAVKNYDPNIITIAGNVGMLFPGTENYVDHIGRGDGIPFLRKLLGEECNRPYKLEVIPAKNTFSLYDVELNVPIAQVVTKLGCPNNCDFCITRRLFNGKFFNSFFTPQQVHDKLVEYCRKLKKDFAILFCEPQGIISKQWWYDLCDLFVDEPEDYPVMITATQASLQKFDFDRISNSSLRFYGFNIGIESFSKDYGKNAGHRNTKALIKKLADYGIATYGTFIIGFDHNTKESIWEEIKQAVDLDMYGLTVHNLKVLPETPLWYEYEKAGRLLDIPYDFYYLEGFQTYTHPHFKPGFADMLPLMHDILEYIEKERGTPLLSFIELLGNIPKKRKLFEKRIELYRKIASFLYPSWKEHLSPSEAQQEKYLQRLGGLTRSPVILKMIQKSKIFRKVVNAII